jgi:hypothetical protein
MNNPDAQRLRFPTSRLLFVLMLWIFLQSGCAMWPEPTRSWHVGAAGPAGGCADFFAMLDRKVTTADAIDAGFSRIRHYPYLRTNRFMASFKGEVADARAFAAWVDHLQALDQSARRSEIAGLSDADVAAMKTLNGRKELFRQVQVCGDLLRKADLLDADDRNRLRRHAAAQDEYSSLRRILGLSPISDLFVSRGVKKWHADVREQFDTVPQPGGGTIRYLPDAKPDVAAAHRVTQQAERDELGIPVYRPDDQAALFRAYAPVWELPAQDDNDRIGAPVWNADDGIAVDTDQPQAYTHLSFTRSAGTILTQLNYIIWFPSRPRDGALDIYAGLLDGLNYRVTLDTEGKPILYETMHNCGCYYQAYPTRHLTARLETAYAEPPLILNAPEINAALESMVVFMEPRTHYVRSLYPLPRRIDLVAVGYTLADYEILKTLPHANGNRKSMFNRYGIVTGSERLERFILWPTGVLSPGAMRQWGKHAVAFVGQRHFDDPFYLDEMFRPGHAP